MLIKMNKSEIVSIIMPVYNGERFIQKTLESVLDQTYLNWELLITNDGSTDNSENIIKKFIEKDNRIKYFKQKNTGSAAARNNSLKNAIGKYIVFLDSDDIWKKEFLQKQLNFLKEKKAKIVFSSYELIDINGKKIGKDFIVPKKIEYKNLLKTCYMSCLTSMYDCESLGKFYFKEELKSLRDDYVMWLSILKKEKYAYGNSEILGSYRIFSESVTGNKKKIIKPHFNVYYKEEKLGIFKSSYYFIIWMIKSILKYR